MSEASYVIRKLEGSATDRNITATVYSKKTGEVTVTVPTSGMDADALPAAIEHAFRVKAESADAANAD